MRAFEQVPGGWASLATFEERTVLRAQARRATKLMADGRVETAVETDPNASPENAQQSAEPVPHSTAHSEDEILAALEFQPNELAQWEEHALQRIFPNASPDDDAASALVRATYGDELRRRKVTRMQALERELTHPSGPEGAILVPSGQEEAWLGALNDLRLLYSARLGFQSDLDVEQTRERVAALIEGQDESIWRQDPQNSQTIYDYSLYELLTWWQESLLMSVFSTEKPS